jgi:lipoyl-dependent peroxiredoxin
MHRIEKVLYTAKAHSAGGRTGTTRSSDGRLEVRLSRPGARAPAPTRSSSSRPAGPLASISAMEFAARNMRIMLPADHAVDAEIDLGPEGGAFSLAARLCVSLPGMERATRRTIAIIFSRGIQELNMNRSHALCQLGQPERASSAMAAGAARDALRPILPV